MKRNNGEEYALLLCNQKCGEKQRISIKWIKWIKWKQLRKSVFNISGHQFALYARRQFGSVYTGVYNVFIFIIRSTVGMKAKNTHSIEQSIFTRSKREIESKKKNQRTDGRQSFTFVFIAMIISPLHAYVLNIFWKWVEEKKIIALLFWQNSFEFEIVNCEILLEYRFLRWTTLELPLFYSSI